MKALKSSILPRATGAREAGAYLNTWSVSLVQADEIESHAPLDPVPCLHVELCSLSANSTMAKMLNSLI